jgi:hypothetical protein
MKLSHQIALLDQSDKVMFRQQSCFEKDAPRSSPLQDSQERLILHEMSQCMRSILRAVEEKQGNTTIRFLLVLGIWKLFLGWVFPKIGLTFSPCKNSSCVSTCLIQRQGPRKRKIQRF